MGLEHLGKLLAEPTEYRSGDCIVLQLASRSQLASSGCEVHGARRECAPRSESWLFVDLLQFRDLFHANGIT